MSGSAQSIEVGEVFVAAQSLLVTPERFSIEDGQRDAVQLHFHFLPPGGFEVQSREARQDIDAIGGDSKLDNLIGFGEVGRL